MRIHKRHIKREDIFLKTVENISRFYYKNPKRFIFTVVLAVIGIVILVYVLQRPGQKSSPEASLLFLQGLSQYDQRDIIGAENTFKQLTSRYGSTIEGQKALFYLANICYHEGRYDESLRYFEKFYKSYQNRKSFLVPAGLLGMGNCYEEMRSYEKACEIYEEMFKKYKDYPLTSFALLSAARCYRQLGRYDKEEETYKKIVNNYKDCPAAEEAKAGLAALEAMRNKF